MNDYALSNPVTATPFSPLQPTWALRNDNTSSADQYINQAIANWKHHLERTTCDTGAPSSEAVRQVRLLILGLTKAELQAEAPPVAFLFTLRARLATYVETYRLVADAAGVPSVQGGRGHVTRRGELIADSTSVPLELREVAAEMAELIENRLHYLRSYRSDAILRLGLFLRGRPAPIAYMAFTRCDRNYYTYGLREYSQTHITPGRIVHLARGYALNMPHSNSFSYMIAAACREHFSADFDLLTSAISPFLGFRAASLRASGFIPFAFSPVTYRFTPAYDAAPRRADRGDYRGTTLASILLTVRGCTHAWMRRLDASNAGPVQVDFALYSLSPFESPHELMSQSGRQALLNVRRYLEFAWDRQTRYGKYIYSCADREARGQCGVTSAYLVRAIAHRGWQATVGHENIIFDNGLPPIQNHCWVEINIHGVDTLIIDLVPDQTGYAETLLVGMKSELASLGVRYDNSHSTRGYSYASKADLANRLAILDQNIAHGHIR